MKPAPVAFVRPTSIEDAVAALGEKDAKVLAGGQSLIPLLSMRLAAPRTLVDINALPDLDHVRCDRSGVRVGALARHADVLASAEAARVQPLLAQALRYVAHPTIRNRGTTVGSLVHADAAAEMPVVLKLLGGSIDAVGPGGRRTIEADDLYVGPLETTIRSDEIAVEAFFPASPQGTGTAFDEIARRHGDYALCGVAATVTVVDGRIDAAKAGYLSVSELPVTVDLTEHLADGITDASLAAAAERALSDLEPAADIHATAEYRAQLVRVLTARVLRAAYTNAGGADDE